MLSEDEERAIAVEVWLEHQDRVDRVKAAIYLVSIAVLACVLAMCAVSLAECRPDCPVVNGLLTGITISAILLVLTVCVCCMECCFDEDPGESGLDRDAMVAAIMEKREKKVLLKERELMNGE